MEKSDLSIPQTSFKLPERTMADEVLDLARITEVKTQIAMAIFLLSDTDANIGKAEIAAELYQSLERLHAIEECHRELEERWKLANWAFEQYKEGARFAVERKK
ncbi:hypothetical protein [Cohnella fermenti]|uniref:Uncharacterized protein n=1 Tax=Cohnella fermenti TaxID=2565925 RepID=A0A4V3WGC1_9BACL|nr:hypothetical protein [Cohnella fermenti]THF83713.1 hypothetical protein E6C55_03205 [Cohnella fermenti]